VTGYPTRREFNDLEWGTARRRLNLSHERSVVLVFGGSRGARSINQALWGCLERLLEKVQVVHITGELDWSQVGEVQKNLPQHIAADYHPYAYLHEEMGDALVSADLVVSRAGAAILGEFPCFGLPSIVVPYPHAWRYQQTNASYLVKHGAAVQIADKELGEKLLPTIEDLLADPQRMEAMATAARALFRPQAANAIASEIEGLVARTEVARG
jgi:UDP-N-acetylglucosamine--N-acetylmuramyl-(pentapeptide) pyrophosphoryl-undecaprenol N-acetylglucosamine transferase